jgi:hypothetical protein
MLGSAMPQVAESFANRLRRIQVELGVEPDSVLGPETLTAIEARLGMPQRAKDASLECSRLSLDAIVEFEVTSAAAYEKKYRRPIWPGGGSGVTIGIGYDLGVTAKADIESDWRGHVSDVELASLLAVQGVAGLQAKTLAQGIAQVEIPFDVAQAVFYQATLPRFARTTRKTYPGVQNLPGDAQGMLLSLVYNRGASLEGPRRTEMAAIKALIRAAADDCLDLVADQVEAMRRLWPDVPGLRTRRTREAALIRNADRAYLPGELVRI